MSTVTRRLLPRSILFALAATSAAAAQEATTPDTGDKDSTLGTIIVTAEKRSEDIQQVPMSIGVIDASTLDNLHATQLADYAAYVPGLTVINGGSPGQATLAIRGIVPSTATATVATYIDETPVGSSSMYGGGAQEILDLLPNDFQSVEVLRGPQGTLYGASAMGGVLRYVTRAPDVDNASARVGADAFTQSGAGDSGYGARAGFNVPLVPGRLAFSASVARQQSPGYTDNVRTGEKEQDAFWQEAAHATLLWKATDALSLTLSAIHSKTDSDSSSYTALDPVSLKPLYGDLKNDNYFLEPYIKSYDVYSATVNWDLDFADFVSATTYAQTKTHTDSDATAVYGVLFPLFGLDAPGLADVLYHLKLYKATQEFRLVSKADDRVEWLAGFFYTRENSKQDQLLTAQFADYSFIPGLSPLAVVGLPSTYKEYAGYGDLTWKFTSRFDATVGVRWAHNSQTFSEITSGALTPPAVVPGESSEDVFTYSVSPRWHVSADTMLYVRVASGYQPGGPNVAFPGVPPSVESSTLTSYEGGIKTILADNRLMFDAAVYDIDWRKIQIAAAYNGLGYFANGGTARSRGVEFSALYTPAPGLRLGLNGAYTDAQLTEDVPDIGGFDGDRLPNIPKWSASATADYTFAVGGGWTGRVGAGLRHAGSSDSAVAHSPLALAQDGYTALDLNADFSKDRWTLRIFAKNVTDERAYTNLTPQPNPLTGGIGRVLGVPLAPRTLGVGFDYQF